MRLCGFAPPTGLHGENPIKYQLQQCIKMFSRTSYNDDRVSVGFHHKSKQVPVTMEQQLVTITCGDVRVYLSMICTFLDNH